MKNCKTEDFKFGLQATVADILEYVELMQQQGYYMRDSLPPQLWEDGLQIVMMKMEQTVFAGQVDDDPDGLFCSEDEIPF